MARLRITHCGALTPWGKLKLGIYLSIYLSIYLYIYIYLSAYLILSYLSVYLSIRKPPGLQSETGVGCFQLLRRTTLPFWGRGLEVYFTPSKTLHGSPLPLANLMERGMERDMWYIYNIYTSPLKVLHLPTKLLVKLKSFI